MLIPYENKRDLEEVSEKVKQKIDFKFMKNINEVLDEALIKGKKNMKITSSNLQAIAVEPKGYPEDELSEIAFVGRSNVGKSSFINSMINRKNLARTSGK